MMEKRVSNLTPTKLRAFLLVSIVVMLVLGGGLFSLFRGLLTSFAYDVQAASSQAETSSNDIEKLKSIQQTLEQDSVAVTRAKSIVADSKSYQYQDQIIHDLSIYANKANIRITGFTFNNAGVGGVGAGSTPTQISATTDATGLKSITVNVAIKNPVTYSAIMQFVHYIEVNLTKMQLTGITIAKADTSKANSKVSVTPITLEVYIQ